MIRHRHCCRRRCYRCDGFIRGDNSRHSFLWLSSAATVCFSIPCGTRCDSAGTAKIALIATRGCIGLDVSLIDAPTQAPSFLGQDTSMPHFGSLVPLKFEQLARQCAAVRKSSLNSSQLLYCYSSLLSSCKIGGLRICRCNRIRVCRRVRRSYLVVWLVQ
jgi:hypothetical protein